MADKKISQLTAATTPLAGTEVLPIVQSGSTVKVSVDNLTTGKAVTVGSLSSAGAISGTALTATGNVSFNGGTFRFNVSKADLDFQVSGDTDDNLIYVDASTDRVGFGRNNPAAKIDVEGAAIIRGNATTTGAVLFGGNVSAPSADAFIIRSADNTMQLGTASAARITIDSSGNSTLNTGNLVVGTAAKGIDFSANTGLVGATKEILDWYEEGTWSPTITSAAGTITSTSISAATYTRIGRQVTASVSVEITDAGTGTGAIKITMPYTAASGSVAVGSAVETVSTGNMGRGILSAGDNTLYVTKYDNGTFIVTGYKVFVSVTYIV